MAKTRRLKANCCNGTAALALAALMVCGGCTQGWNRTAPSPWSAPTSPAAAVLPPPQVAPASGPGAGPAPTVRGQGDWNNYEPAPGTSDYLRGPMRVADETDPPAAQGRATGNADPGRQTVYQPPTAAHGATAPPPASGSPLLPPPPTPTPSAPGTGADVPLGPTAPLTGDPLPYTPSAQELLGTPVPLDVRVEEGRTGRFMFGAGINSDAGVTGQIIIDERNFNLFGFPRSFDEILNGEAFRGGGQGFRVEAIPGDRVQRYLVSFTEPYLLWTPISLNVSGFYYDRGYFDWDENRLGGRIGLGYRLTPDLSVSATARGERVRVSDIRVPGVAALEEVEGDNELYSGKFAVRHDTRDLPFIPTEGHLIELSFEQAFGDFDYPRGEVDYRRYFLVRERPDGSGRHTLSFSLGAGFSGVQTPVFENYYAGGFSTLRGFEFRGASPVERTVRVGGRFRMLGSVQYMMPITADDMIRAVGFVDFGTVERDIEIRDENFRVAPGFGFRISIPAMGPAPLAFDFAFPIAQAVTDEEELFSFFFGFGRG